MSAALLIGRCWYQLPDSAHCMGNQRLKLRAEQPHFAE
jgi:hypothetical protein